MIKIATISYSLALARNAKKMLSEIAVSASDLAVVSTKIKEQQNDFKTSIEHISLAWNATLV